MRILCSRFAQEIGGAEKSFFAHIRAFEALGHEVHAFTNLALPESVEATTHDALWFRRSSKTYKVLVAPLQILSALRMVKRYDPDIINPHSRFDQILLSLLKPLHKKPLVWKDPVELKQRLEADTLASKLDKRALKRADKVYALSHEQKDQLLPLLPAGFDRSRVEVVPSGIDFSQYDNAAEPTHQSSDLTIGYAARLHPAKGVDDLILAFETMRKKHPAKLLIMGEGEHKLELEELVGNLGLADSVDFIPYTEDVSGFLRSLDIYACPSHYESWGLGVHEARLFGLPIVATNVGGLAEQIDDNVNGLLVPPKDSTALAQAIEKYIDDGELRFRLGEAAEKDARERGDFAQTVDSKLLPIFEECLS